MSKLQKRDKPTILQGLHREFHAQHGAPLRMVRGDNLAPVILDDAVRDRQAQPGAFADLKMPGMDGLTVIREAKRYKSDLPVIIITGFSTESSAIEAVNLGVAGYLTKPFRVPQVLAAAAKALGE